MGIRKPNYKSRIRARTTGKMKRKIKKSNHSRIWEKGNWMGKESKESSLQQGLQQNYSKYFIPYVKFTQENQKTNSLIGSFCN